MGPSDRVAARGRLAVPVNFLCRVVSRGAVPIAALLVVATASCDSVMVLPPMDMSATTEMLTCKMSATCNGALTCLDENPDHCGACNNPCNRAGLTCHEGRCEKICNPDGGMRFTDAGVAIIYSYCEMFQECFDLNSDTQHCGGCTTVCNQDQTCAAGQCVLNCGNGLTACGDKCVNTSIDRANCGACNKACDINSPLCVDGKCTSACPLDTRDCPGVGCVNPYNDPAHCGDQCQGCQQNQVCSNKQCKAQCDQGTTKCLDNNGASRCVNLANDPGNCGTCRNSCAPGTVCSSGQCVGQCAQGYTLCKDKNGSNLGCFDLQTDPSHCGSCPTDPPNPDALCKDTTPFCVAGKCTNACPYNNCNGGCVDFNTDPHNCGACADPTKLNMDPHVCKAASEVCYMGTCVEATKCPVGTIPCGRTCVDCAPPHGQAVCDPLAFECRLGMCDIGWTDCNKNPLDGCEIHTDADTTNCGVCKQVCNVTNGAPACVGGICAIGSCIAGWGDCKNGYMDGCETNIDNEVTSCGKCGNVCAALNGMPACSKGTCLVASCGMGFEDCDKVYGTGCEINTQNDPKNCGACARPCVTPNATPACASGKCEVGKCDPGFLDCNGLPADGCEVNANTDSVNCGACGKTCTAPNSAGSCANGFCKIDSCTKGYGDCDKVFGNGCETSLDTAQNCGLCNLVCPPPQQGQAACNSGICGVGGCAPGFADCDNKGNNGCETNTQVDANNCGNCGNICPALPNAGPACSAGKCSLSCKAPWQDCDNQILNGCETDTSSNSASCGGCGRVCSLPNASPACVGSSCIVAACADGFADCNKQPNDGCEVNVTNDANNCNGCGLVCAITTNATASRCSAKTCAVLSCANGFADCDGIYANGCEISTTSNSSNCGACGRACVPTVNVSTVVCSQSTCSAASCNAGFADCDHQFMNGCEINTSSDANNCNGCGNVCLPTANVRIAGCTASACSVAACNVGTADCDKKFSNGCEVDTTVDAVNCGSCGVVCLPTANVSTVKCGNSNCAVNTCNAGFANCDNQFSNGCEINTNTDVSNCGGCGQACVPTANVATTLCGQGSCKVGTCKPGFADCDGQFANGCEVATTSDVNNCNSCGNRCVPTINVVNAVCSGSNCAVGSCQAGFADCDKQFANGCEVNVTTNNQNCGACGNLCTPTANVVSAGCSGSACSVTACVAGFADCDVQYLNGCEINTATDVNNCNGCTKKCTLTSNAATVGCTGSACGVSSCIAPFADCDKQYGNGCEANTGVDVNNCGTCGKVCVPTANVSLAGCNGGSCTVSSCNGTTADCDKQFANGCEVNTANDVNNCGGCGRICTPTANVNTVACSLGNCVVSTCKPGFADCDGQFANGCEVNTSVDANNCGLCGKVCTLTANASTATCSAGACAVATCMAPWADCDAKYANGCEANTTNDAINCGACAKVCTATPNSATTVCTNSACSVATCNSGFADCDGQYPNGCEIVTTNNAANCGACGNVCKPGAAVSTVSCSASSCVVASCNGGFADCDKQFANGCEVNTTNSVSNCGACGTLCTPGTNVVTPVCNNSACAVAACNAGFADCDQVFSNGCEINTTSNVNNCGSCGNVCTPGTQVSTVACSGGACAVTSCRAGFADCDKAFNNGCEIDTTVNVSNCGGCGQVCTPGSNVNAVNCTTSTCRVTGCNAGSADCDKVFGNGCEINTNTNTNNCGACGTVCTAGANVSSVTCNVGVCGVASCNNSFADCDGLFNNGCEVNITTSTQNCGGCGMACTLQANTASVACAGTGCSVATCNANFADCDKVFTNGCEVNTSNDTANCGVCGRVCTAPANTQVASVTCGVGSCGVAACNMGYSDCDKLFNNGCEINTTNDTNNCGACGTKCATGASCVMGACVCPMAQPDTCSNVCVDKLTSTSNCGACGMACVNGTQVASEKCAGGLCAVNACNSGFLDCDLLNGNGCEVNKNTDVNNCGTCGLKCPTGATCVNGTCTCPGGAPTTCGNNPGACVNTTNDTNNCGACGTVCTPGQNVMTVSCAASTCTIVACDMGYDDCDGTFANGCEVHLADDPLNCGTCHTKCMGGNGTCLAGLCL